LKPLGLRRRKIPRVPQPRRVVKIATLLPQTPETAENIMFRLGRRAVGEDARRFIVTRGPGDHNFSVDAGGGIRFSAARRLVVAALDQLARDWREHLIVMEPEPRLPGEA
jgi:hypothetical protein